MNHISRLLSLFLCLLLLSGIPRAEAEEVTAEGCMEKLIAYYFHYREQAAGEIGHQLALLEELDPEQGALWQEIMDRWAWANEEMPINTGALPGDLPEDDSLCIVVLGYALEKNGAMKPELLDRLEVALAAAEQYPNAYVLCTGGETSGRKRISEAGQMGSWLLEMGLEEERLILETKSLSTTENARNSFRILWREYPQVDTVALVTSDYHIRWSTVSFQTEALLGKAEGKTAVRVGTHSACETEQLERERRFYQAWSIALLTGIPFDGEWVPELYMPQETAAPGPEETEQPAAPAPMAVSQPAAEDTLGEEPVLPVLLVLAAVMLLIFTPRKKR